MTVKQPRGLPYNMPAHSLQRSQYVNGLAELTPEIRRLGVTEGCRKNTQQKHMFGRLNLSWWVEL